MEGGNLADVFFGGKIVIRGQGEKKDKMWKKKERKLTELSYP